MNYKLENKKNRKPINLKLKIILALITSFLAILPLVKLYLGHYYIKDLNFLFSVYLISFSIIFLISILWSIYYSKVDNRFKEFTNAYLILTALLLVIELYTFSYI